MRTLSEILNGKDWKELDNFTNTDLKNLKERRNYLESQDFDGWEDEYIEMMQLRTILSS